MRELNDVVKGVSGPREAGGLVLGPWAYTGTTLGKQGQKDPRDLVRAGWSSQLTSRGEILSLV